MDQREAAYYQETIRLLEEAYVSADERGDAAGGSGSSGGLEQWELKRRVIASAFDHDGTWLDIGCANGLLMETLTGWTAAKGLRIKPFGVDLSQRIVERARLRLPQWSDRIWAGNVMTWEPPLRFDYVTLLPEHVPGEQSGAMLKRVSQLFLNAGGRLIVSYYFSRDAAQPSFHGRPQGAPPLLPAGVLLTKCGFTALGEAEARRDDGSLWTSVAWFDRGA